MSDGDEGFLNRWSRRKAAARDGGPAEPAAADAAALGPDAAAPAEPAQTQAEAEKSEEEILAELGLPKPEEIQPGDGVAGFMRAGVPKALQRRALRRLWAINPALANLDRMVDYGEDYTDAATVVDRLNTIYEAGSGYKKLFARLDAEAEAAAQAAEDAAAGADAQAGQSAEEEPSAGEEPSAEEGPTIEEADASGASDASGAVEAADDQALGLRRPLDDAPAPAPITPDQDGETTRAAPAPTDPPSPQKPRRMRFDV